MHDEVNRIRQVYREYNRSHRVQVRRADANPGNRQIAEERAQVVANLLHTHGLAPLRERRVLDVGCGHGGVLASLLDLAAQPHKLYGIDLLQDRIEAARRAYPDIDFACGNAEHLDFADAYFDLVLLFTVFSSILDDGMAHNIAREVRRVLKPGGAVLWYDFRYNNPWNPRVRGMTKSRMRQFFPDFQMHLRTITLLPPLARHLGRLTPVLYSLLAAIPALRTHYLGLLIRPPLEYESGGTEVQRNKNQMRDTFLPFSPALLGEEEIAEVVDTLRSDWFTTGPKVRRFEEEFAVFIGAPAALALNSCTAAVHVALAALGIGPGDARITPIEGNR